VVRRLVPLALALGVAAMISPLEERWPSSHAVEVALDARATVREVALTARRNGDDVHHVRWIFAPGSAPERVHADVHGPDGPYELIVELDRTDGTRASHEHHVDLGDGRTVVHAR
jgi:hypothetical protein